MSWIVVGQEKGLIKLVSKSAGNNGILPKGSFLTVEPENTDSKFILRVEDSIQHDPFSPSPLVVDMDLSTLNAEKKSQNIVLGYRIKDINNRDDGLIDFIPPQSLARRSNQEEVNMAFGDKDYTGPEVFPATIHAGTNQLLLDEQKNILSVNLPEDFFYYQTQICGKTGYGKTVASKYLAQYFVEELNGAVLAINVKDVDFLRMDQESTVQTERIKREWDELGEEPRAINNFKVYYPATTNIEETKGINYKNCIPVTLDVQNIKPESLTGLLQTITGTGAQSFPDIFRYWKENEMEKYDTFNTFVKYFSSHRDALNFDTLNINGDEGEVPIHHGTFNNILRNINEAVKFFDNEDAESLSHEDILTPGKMSVINVDGEHGNIFGSILLRHLLKQIVRAKSNKKGTGHVPILVIIDEVHQFYNTDASKDALGELDTICRKGRSQEIGIIFSSQNENDIPKGLSSVINTKIFFKSDGVSKKEFGISSREISTLKKGYAVANINELPELKILKFPLAYAGVIDD